MMRVMLLSAVFTSSPVIWFSVVMNAISFISMGVDKHKAMRGKNAERAAEGTLFFMASIFGAIGIYLGMFLFRHKIRKWYFQIGIPLLVLQNAAAIYVVQAVWQLW